MKNLKVNKKTVTKLTEKENKAVEGGKNTLYTPTLNTELLKDFSR